MAPRRKGKGGRYVVSERCKFVDRYAEQKERFERFAATEVPKFMNCAAEKFRSGTSGPTYEREDEPGVFAVPQLRDPLRRTSPRTT